MFQAEFHLHATANDGATANVSRLYEKRKDAITSLKEPEEIQTGQNFRRQPEIVERHVIKQKTAL